MKMKRRMAFVAAMLAMTLTACTSAPTEPTTSTPEGSSAAANLSGTYTAAATGKNGDVNVTVTFADGKIASVEVGEHNETAGICDTPIERIPAAIVEYQSVAVDAVAGATMTSEAIINATKACIEQAGGAVANFEKKIEKPVNDAVVEVDCDVVVVGVGGSGSAAALAASQGGASVIAIEKTAMVGGSAAMSGGMAAVDSRLQKADPQTNFTGAQWLKEWLTQQNYMVNAPMVSKYISESGKTVDWLLDNGLELTFVGHSQEALADDPIRTYHVWANDDFGANISAIIENSIKKGGIQLYTETAAKEILMADGKAVGVVATQADGSTLQVNAKAVIIATGGYGASNEKMMEVLGFKANGINSGAQTGDGIQMGIEAGADTVGYSNVEFHGAHSAMDLVADAGVSNMGFNLDQVVTSAAMMWVNADGYRFTNEDICYDSSYIGNTTAQQGDHYYALLSQSMVDTLETSGTGSYGITIDNVGFGAPGYTVGDGWAGLQADINQGLSNGLTVKANTLEELAVAAGINAENLVATVEAYNAACKAGVDEMYSKDAQFLIPIENGPYYLVMGRATQLCSLGGLKIDTDMRVVDTNNNSIPGLYACGVDASGSMYNNAYVSYEGVTMGWALTSGRIAGENAAEYVK